MAALLEAAIALLTSIKLLNLFCAVQVWAIPRPPTVAEELGKVIVVESVPARVSELLAISVLPSATARVDEVAGAVIAILLMEVALATPRTGVTRVGVPANTKLPVPVAPVEVTPSIVWCPVKVLAASVRAIVADVVGKVMVVVSVPAKVMLLLAVSVFPSAIVSVDDDAGAVMVTLFIVVAVAAPRVGVTITGELKKFAQVIFLVVDVVTSTIGMSSVEMAWV